MVYPRALSADEDIEGCRLLSDVLHSHCGQRDEISLTFSSAAQTGSATSAATMPTVVLCAASDSIRIRVAEKYTETKHNDNNATIDTTGLASHLRAVTNQPIDKSVPLPVCSPWCVAVSS